MPKWIEAFSVRGVNETRFGQTVSSLPKEIMREVNKKLADLDNDAEVNIVSTGSNALVFITTELTDNEVKKRLEDQDEATDRVGDQISVQEANKRAKAEKEEVDGKEMKKAEEEFQESLKTGNEEEEVEEDDGQGGKRKVKKRKSR